MNFRMDFSISAKKQKTKKTRHLDYKGIESIDHFG